MNQTIYLAVMVPAMVLGCAWCVYVIAQCVRDLMAGREHRQKASIAIGKLQDAA